MIKSGGQITYETKGNSLIVHIGGEIDHHSAVSARVGIDETVLSERPGRVLLELSAVDFMDSSGLGLIMGRFALVSRYGGDFAVLDASPAVLRMIKLAGMERKITVLRSRGKDEKKA